MESSSSLLFVLNLIAALGCGLVAGTFFAFSTFVMKAFARLPAHQGIAAMQSINVVVLNPWFMSALFGTAVACVVALVFAILRWHDPWSVYAFAGASLYLVGSVLVTIVFNVPRNETLAGVAPTDAASAALWATYVTSWTAWNHVRTAAALAAAASFSIALAC
jgi:uncharacterized membrane protein